MAKKVLAITKEGKLTYCTADPDKRGIGRCNHVAHKEEDEEVSDFIEKHSKKGKIIPYKMSILEQSKLMEIRNRTDLANEDCIEGGYIPLDTPVWNNANIAEFSEISGVKPAYIRAVIDKKKEIKGFGTGVEALNDFADSLGYTASTEVYVLPYFYREDTDKVKNPLNGLYNYICTSKTPEKRQAAYDLLLENEKAKDHGLRPLISKGFPVPSLSSRFNGKHGIIRAEMTGYSVKNTSHMVISPCAGLTTKEVGVPPTMAAELYEDQIYAKLIEDGNTPVHSRDWISMMKDKSYEPKQEDIDRLDRIMTSCKCKAILKRDPSLHTSSNAGFYLRINGTSNIKYNSLGQKGLTIPRSKNTYMMCPSIAQGFNFDMDGDMMTLIRSDIPNEDFDKTYTTDSIFISRNPSNLKESALKPTKDSMFGLLNILIN